MKVKSEKISSEFQGECISPTDLNRESSFVVALQSSFAQL